MSSTQFAIVVVLVAAFLLLDIRGTILLLRAVRGDKDDGALHYSPSTGVTQSSTATAAEIRQKRIYMALAHLGAGAFCFVGAVLVAQV